MPMNNLDTLVIDFETFHDVGYSLRQMPTLLYIRSPQFKVHGAAVKFNNNPIRWLDSAERLSTYLQSFNADNTLVVSHNSNFDMTILAERFGVKPKYMTDTLALCRALLPQDYKFDLGTCAWREGWGGKLDDGAALKAVKGQRDLSAEQLFQLGKYAVQDVEITYKLYEKYWPLFPDSQREVLNLLIKISTHGALRLDLNLASECLDDILAERTALAEKLGLEVQGHTCKQLTSRTEFARLLEATGVTPPTKVSPRTGKETYAFSRGDPAFVALSSNPKCADLIKARMAYASNSELTRIQHLKDICEKPPYTLPVQLNFSGAHTHRLSGGGGINMQNLNRGSKLRRAICAPPKQVIVVVDLSQIELRLNMWFSGQRDVLDFLAADGDIYVAQASLQLGISQSDVTSQQRQFGKVCELGLGYQMGAQKFQSTCAIGPMGVAPIMLSDEQAQQAINTYRRERPKVVESWRWCHTEGVQYLAGAMTAESSVVRGACLFERNRVVLPDGLALHYPGLTTDENDERSWVWGIHPHIHRIYGGILQENIIQALAQCICKHYMLEFQTAFQDSARVVHQVHDEILLLVNEPEADAVLGEALQIMSVPPTWCQDLPIMAKGDYDWRYSK